MTYKFVLLITVCTVLSEHFTSFANFFPVYVVGQHAVLRIRKNPKLFAGSEPKKNTDSDTDSDTDSEPETII
jgi:hypothetical protein